VASTSSEQLEVSLAEVGVAWALARTPQDTIESRCSHGALSHALAAVDMSVAVCGNEQVIISHPLRGFKRNVASPSATKLRGTMSAALSYQTRENVSARSQLSELCQMHACRPFGLFSTQVLWSFTGSSSAMILKNHSGNGRSEPAWRMNESNCETVRPTVHKV